MSEKKNLMRMDKLELITLLERLTEENDTLRQRASEMQEANARLTLAAREAEQQHADMQAQLTQAQAHIASLEETPGLAAPEQAVADADQPWQAEAVPYGLSAQPDQLTPPQIITAEEAPAIDVPVRTAALPLGSFAEAMVAVQQLTERTQQAADEYMQQCRAACDADAADARRMLDEAREEAEQLRSRARVQADTILRDAEERRAALDAQEASVRTRLRGEIDQLNRMIQAMELPGPAAEDQHAAD